jgi:NSS family neurotransmitter:Na+ symporter
MKSDGWKSTLGFVVAAAGSAVGLVNIWRFPYIVGEHGGAAFIAVYILFLLLIGLPVLLCEVLIGRSSGKGPALALSTLGKGSPAWGAVGKGIALTGFIVSSFYSVVAGWILGYLVFSLTGSLSSADSVQAASSLFASSTGSVVWTIGYHALFMGLAALVLVRGVRRGIEAVNKLLMPLLVLLLLGLAIWGLTLPGGSNAIGFLLRLDWSQLTPLALLTALGHAFFTLSLGQGTMIAYGSYLKKKGSLLRICSPILIFDTLVSLLAGVAVISLVFAGGGEPSGGVGLLFSTLPAAFAAIPGGSVVAIGFFLLVAMAALTSQTSAMEPAINYLVVDRKWKRRWAVGLVSLGGFALGIPSALAFNLWRHATLGGHSFFDVISFVAMDVLIPLGGLAAVLFVGWKWGFSKAARELLGERETVGTRARTLRIYFALCVRFVTPALITLIFLANLGLIKLG